MRRRLVASIVVAATIASVTLVAVGNSGSATRPPTPAQVALGKVKHIVVIYEENHSFDNLYGGWDGVNGRQNGAALQTQVNQAGVPFTCLKELDVNFATPPQSPSCTDTTTATSFSSAFANKPFAIESVIPSSATTCPAQTVFGPANGILNGAGLPGGCTRDLVHRYYQEQYQLDGGKMDRYVTGSDSAGLVMGYYETKSLPVYQYLHQKNHPAYAISDAFFQGSFGGSFLNHQWLVAAASPVFANALNDGSANDLHSVVDANGMPNNYPLYASPLAAAVRDNPLTASCNPPAGRPATPGNVVCGSFAVNTIQPFYQPFSPGTADARRLPPLTNPTIGDDLTAHKVTWAWYSGGWSNADGDTSAPGWTNGSGPKCSDPNASPAAVYPNCPDGTFQFHHQAFNYFASFAPGTAQRTNDLRDETEFIQAAQSSQKTCGLRSVSFIKPLGVANEHPGYASEKVGSDHLVMLLKAIEGGACAKDTMVIVTYDEFGGQWDHVPPPGQGSTTPGPHDVWGPGTRIPALTLAPQLKSPFVVDSVSHDTTSIIATIEHRFSLPAVGTRDAEVKDLSSVFTAKAVKAR